MSLRHAPVCEGKNFKWAELHNYMHFSHKAHTACCARDIGNLTSVSQNVGYFHQYNTKIVNKFCIEIFFFFKYALFLDKKLAFQCISQH